MKALLEIIQTILSLFGGTKKQKVTTPSKDLKNCLMHLYQLPNEKITVIPNIVDTDHFRPHFDQNDNRPFTILHVGRFERAKGVITLIKAFIRFVRAIM